METTAVVHGGTLVLPADVLRAMGAVEGDRLTISAEAGRIVMTRQPAAATAAAPAPGAPSAWTRPGMGATSWAPPAVPAPPAPASHAAAEPRPAKRALRVFLYALIGSLSAGALLAIGLLLVDSDLTVLQAKIIGTAAVVGGFSLLGLCSSSWYDRQERVWLAGGGVATAAVALLLSVIAIWGEVSASGYYRALTIAVIVAVAWALSSLELVFYGRDHTVDVVVLATVGLIALFTALVIVPILTSFDGLGEGYGRLVAVVLILAVLGSVVSPVLARAVRRDD
jgi:hypothetical protein